MWTFPLVSEPLWNHDVIEFAVHCSEELLCSQHRDLVSLTRKLNLIWTPCHGVCINRMIGDFKTKNTGLQERRHLSNESRSAWWLGTGSWPPLSSSWSTCDFYEPSSHEIKSYASSPHSKDKEVQASLWSNGKFHLVSVEPLTFHLPEMFQIELMHARDGVIASWISASGSFANTFELDLPAHAGPARADC